MSAFFDAFEDKNGLSLSSDFSYVSNIFESHNNNETSLFAVPQPSDDSLIYVNTKPSTINYYSYFHQKKCDQPLNSNNNNNTNNSLSFPSYTQTTHYSSHFPQTSQSSLFCAPTSSVSSHSQQLSSSFHHQQLPHHASAQFNHHTTTSHMQPVDNQESWTHNSNNYPTQESTYQNGYYFQSSLIPAKSDLSYVQHAEQYSPETCAATEIHSNDLRHDENGEANPSSFWEEAVSSKLIFPKNEELTSTTQLIRKDSSECSESSTTLDSGKLKDKSAAANQQSQLKNANKFCMVSLLNFLTDTLPCTKSFHHLIKYIIRVKGSGKLRQKVDIFTLSHFRLLFLNLNDWNISQLSACDINMHRMVFSELSKPSASNASPFTKEDLDYMNGIKQQLLQISISFFENSANIKQKIQQKPWQNEDTAKYYLEWVNRITKGIKKMASGVYIHRF